MEEKKTKRVRPTVAQVREMEETVHRQCVELDAWRDKYRELDRRYKKFRKEMEAGKVVPESEYGNVVKLNKQYEGEKGVLEKKVSLLEATCDEKQKALERLDSEKVTLEMSNRSMEDELKRNANRHEGELKRWKEKAIDCETELMRLQSRGFFARLFNL